MENLLALCKDMETATFAAGDVLIPEGGKTGCLFILISGTVEITKGETFVTRIDEPGAIFGELSILLGRDHPASVRAVDGVSCYVSPADKEFLVENPRINLAVAELLAVRLKGMIGYLADLKSQYEDRQDHLGMVDELLLQMAHRMPKR